MPLLVFGIFHQPKDLLYSCQDDILVQVSCIAFSILKQSYYFFSFRIFSHLQQIIKDKRILFFLFVQLLLFLFILSRNLFFLFSIYFLLFWAVLCFSGHNLQLINQYKFLISQFKQAMKRSRITIFIVFLQIIFGLIIFDFYFNPHQLRTQCESAVASSDKFGYGDIVDCVACYVVSDRDSKEKFIGKFDIFLPKKSKEQHNINEGQAFDQGQQENIDIKPRFLFLANIFSQKGCTYYECSSLQILQDYKLREDYSLQILKKLHIQEQKDIIFQVKNKSLLQFSPNTQKYALKLASNFLLKKEFGSLIVKTRYSVDQNIQKNHQPFILLHRLNTSIYVRFIILIIPLVFSINLLLSFITQPNLSFKTILVLLLLIGFISQDAAIISSSVAIYLTIGKIYKYQIYGIVIALLFLAAGFTVTFPLIFALTTLYIFGLILKETINQFSYKTIAALLAILINTVYMRVVQWQYYVHITPVILLAALVSIHCQQPAQEVTYDSVDGQQDKDQLSNAKIQP